MCLSCSCVRRSGKLGRRYKKATEEKLVVGTGIGIFALVEMCLESEKGSSSNKISDERSVESVGSELDDRPKSCSYEYALKETLANSAKDKYSASIRGSCSFLHRQAPISQSNVDFQMERIASPSSRHRPVDKRQNRRQPNRTHI